MNLKEYIDMSKKTYQYTIKIAADKLDKDKIDCIKECLARYEVKKFSGPKSTPPIEESLIFPNVKNCSIQTFEMESEYPATLDAIERQISEVLQVQRMMVVVWGERDPRRFAIEQHIRNKAAKKEDYEPALGSDYEKSDNSELYGQERIDTVMKDNKKAQKDRKITTVVNPLSPKQTIDKSTHVDKGMGPKNEKSPLSSKPKQKGAK